VKARRSGQHVLIVDLDPQGTADDWYQERDDNRPKLVTIAAAQLPEALQRAKAAQVDWVFIDTAGRDEPATGTAIEHADFCLVPCRPSAVDMKALPPTIKMLEEEGTPYAIVISQAHSRGKRKDKAKSRLSQIGSIAPIPIVSRVAHQDAYLQGLGVTEHEPRSEAAAEISALWSWLKKQVKRAANG